MHNYLPYKWWPEKPTFCWQKWWYFMVDFEDKIVVIHNSTVRYESSWEPKTASANVKYGLRNKNVVEYSDLCLIQE